MSPKPLTAQLREVHVTPGQREMRDWHIFLGKASQAAAIALILGSYVALQWASHFVGLRPLTGQMLAVGWFATLMSFIVPLAIEGGMAIIGATLTSVQTGTRIDEITGELRQVPRVWLVTIFCFLMALAQAANIGHAVVAVHEALSGPEGGTLPPQLPTWVIYTFACAFAALFPLGGTFMIYVAGYLREHGTGAKWITEGTEKVHVETAADYAHTPAAAKPAARKAAPTPAAQATPSPAPAAARPLTPAAVTAAAAEAVAEARATLKKATTSEDPAREQLFREYAQRKAAGDRMQGPEIAERLGIDVGHARNLRLKWDKQITTDGPGGTYGERAELDIDNGNDDDTGERQEREAS